MISDVRKTADQKMHRSIETLKADLAKIRTGRAHTGLLDHIHVDYYGTSMPLSQVANVTLAASDLTSQAALRARLTPAGQSTVDHGTRRPVSLLVM